jgi:hypothetical protein
MKATLTFLFGKETAHRMHLLEAMLQTVQHNHQAYFATTRSKLITGDNTQPATLAEFVQPRWQASVPTLDIDATLPPEIAAECLACLHHVATLPPSPTASRKFRTKLGALFTSSRPTLQRGVELLAQ